MNFLEFLLCLSRLRTQHSVCKDSGLIPGLAQWVKDPASLQAAMQVADVARMDPSSVAVAVVQASAAALILPLAWKLPYALGAAVKRKKKNKLLKIGEIYKCIYFILSQTMLCVDSLVGITGRPFLSYPPDYLNY